MAEKVSLKIFIVITLFFGILSACRHPVDIQAFMEDDNIRPIIAATKVKVLLSDDSDKSLTGGNRIISGLNKNKYYMIEKEFDKDNSPVTPDEYPKYVSDTVIQGYPNSGPGGFYPDLEYITKIKDGQIKGLTNLNTYVVKSAADFGSSVSFTYSIDDVPQTPLTVTTGSKITIPASTGTIKLVDLDTIYDGYDVMAVAVTPSALPSTSDFYDYTKQSISSTQSSFKLEAATTTDTTTDYVFAKKGDTKVDFKVLSIVVEAPTYGIILSQITPYTFPNESLGYPTSPILPVSVNNTGNQETGVLAVALSGTNKEDFDLSVSSIPSIPKNDNAAAAFIVSPKTGLAVGTYNATVTVSGNNEISASFNVSFTVVSTGVSFTITVTVPTDMASPPSLSSNSISVSNLDNNNSVLLTLAQPLSGTWTSIVWYIAGVDLTGLNGNSILEIKNSGVFSGLFAKTGTTIEICVSAILNNVVPYSAKVPLNIVP